MGSSLGQLHNETMESLWKSSQTPSIGPLDELAPLRIATVESPLTQDVVHGQGTQAADD